VEAEETEAEDVTDADEVDDDAAEVVAAPVPLDVKTAVCSDPTLPLATQVPATVLLVS
jgi:hypothetical protein